MALVVGNTVKAGVRFVSYDHFKHMLADPQVSKYYAVKDIYADVHSRAK
jgi:hypothetical protein